MSERLRRLRRTPGLRELVRETRVAPSDLIYPIFVSETARELEPIASMPGQYRLPLSAVANTVCLAAELGVGAVLIFGLPSAKDDAAKSALNPKGIVQNAIRVAK